MTIKSLFTFTLYCKTKFVDDKGVTIGCKTKQRKQYKDGKKKFKKNNNGEQNNIQKPQD